MGQKYLLDSNVIIDYMAGNFDESTNMSIHKIINNDFYISFISQIEIFVYNLSQDEAKQFEDFISLSNIILININIIDLTIFIRKKYKLKIPDAIIAATCISQNLTLISNNDKDFQKVVELKYKNPFREQIGL